MSDRTHEYPKRKFDTKQRHAGYDPAEHCRLRLSVGIEGAGDLIADLKRALE